MRKPPKSDLSIREYLTALASPDREITISFNEIGRAVGYSRQTCLQAVARLEAAGFLTRARGIGSNGKDLPNTYRINAEG
jgi:DNA-binding Lrp family transcriptional regulator